MVSSWPALANRKFGVSGNFSNKHTDIILGSAQTIVNKFHDLNKKNPYSIRNVCGMISHPIPAKTRLGIYTILH